MNYNSRLLCRFLYSLWVFVCTVFLDGSTSKNVDALKVALEDPPVQCKDKSLKVCHSLWSRMLLHVCVFL